MLTDVINWDDENFYFSTVSNFFASFLNKAIKEGRRLYVQYSYFQEMGGDFIKDYNIIKYPDAYLKETGTNLTKEDYEKLKDYFKLIINFDTDGFSKIETSWIEDRPKMCEMSHQDLNLGYYQIDTYTPAGVDIPRIIRSSKISMKMLETPEEGIKIMKKRARILFSPVDEATVPILREVHEFALKH